MDFALSSEQRLMQAALGRALDDHSPLERVRAVAVAKDAAPRELWSGLAPLGLPGVLIAEEAGGLGLALLDAALMAEILGSRVAPTPFLSSAVLTPLALAAETDPRLVAWLPRLASGEAIASVGISEAVAGPRDGAGLSRKDGRLSGTALFVLGPPTADVFLFADASGDLHLVETDDPGLQTIALSTIDDTQAVCEARLDRVAALPLERARLALLRDAAFIILAGDMLGAAQAMLDKALAYARERQQFGRPIGAFQAVKHLCAEMAAEIEPARALVWYAAHAFDAMPDEASLAACHAKAHLSEVGRFVARTATEVHGGIGFTDLLGLHFWFKRVGLSRQLLGGPERVRLEAARLQGLAA
ncbi:MAG: acyl-CoA dehydrogenase family protein [Caulobacteraceae bacterium]